LNQLGRQADSTTAHLVQEYVDKPLLLDGYKSHLRLYVLVTSVNPLRCFLYKDGMFHLASEKYLTPAENNAVSVLIK
jgi:Tubulin-tyrosine ligase family